MIQVYVKVTYIFITVGPLYWNRREVIIFAEYVRKPELDR